MLKGTIMLFFLCVFCCGYAQIQLLTSELDSVTYYIEKSEKLQFSESLRLSFAEKSVKIAERNQNKEAIITANLNLVGFLFSKNNSLVRLQKIFLDLERSTVHSSKVVLNNYWYKKGAFYHFKHVGDSAFYFYNKGLKSSLLQENNHQSKIGYYNISRILYECQEYVGAKKNILLGLDIPLAVNDFKISNSLYLLKSKVEFKMGNKEEAYQDLFVLKNRAVNFEDSTSIAYAYNKIGTMLLSQKSYDSAFYYFEKGIAIKKSQKLADKEDVSLISNRSYTAYYKYGNKHFFTESAQYITMCKKEGFGNLLFELHFRLAKVYKERLEYAKAEKHINLAIGNFSSNELENLYAALFLGASLDTYKAIKYTSQYLRLTDSINFLNKDVRTKISKIKFEVNRKEQLNLALKKENTQKKSVIEKVQFNNIISGLGLLAAFLMFITLSYSIVQRKKKQLYIEKLERVEAREEERQRLAKKLHDEIAGDLNMLHLRIKNTGDHKLAKAVNSIGEIVREMSHELSSESFEEVGFKDQIINLVTENFKPSLDIKITGLNDVIWGNIASSVKRVLYLGILSIVKNTTGDVVQINFSLLDDIIKTEVKEYNALFDFKKLPYFISVTESIQEINGEVKSMIGDKGRYTIIIPTMNI
ncbi:MAG: hypothetical protein COB98_00840 [Flavobacteriaceae bacterium]|nr:MAG: hypothetical protein COB98_00840 [Flavobacteriaceae bacterium]